MKSTEVCQVIRGHSPRCTGCTAYNFKVPKLHLYLRAVLEPISYWNRKGLEISFPAGRHSNSVDSYACCFFYATNAF